MLIGTKSKAGLAAMLAALALAAPGYTRSADTGQLIEVSERMFRALTLREGQRGRATDRVMLDRHDFTAAITLKNAALEDGLVDAAEKALMRAIFAAEPTFNVRSGSQTLEVTRFESRSAFSTLLFAFSDYDCATSFWLHGALNVEAQQGALSRTNMALEKHLEANAGLERAAVERQLMAEGHARGRRIQQGQESAAGLTADLTACAFKYRNEIGSGRP